MRGEVLGLFFSSFDAVLGCFLSFISAILVLLLVAPRVVIFTSACLFFPLAIAAPTAPEAGVPFLTLVAS